MREQTTTEDGAGRGREVPGSDLTLEDRVCKALRVALIKGQFSPGEGLSIRSLAQVFETSVMPVRSAVNRLVAEGAFVRLRSRSGFRVPTITRKSLDELYYLRARLEGRATELAALRMTDTRLEVIVACSDALEVTLQGDDIGPVLSAHQEYLFAIYESAESELLLPMIETLWLRFGPVLVSAALTMNMELFRNSQVLVDPMTAALRRNDGDAAKRVMEKMLSKSSIWIRQYVNILSAETSSRLRLRPI